MGFGLLVICVVVYSSIQLSKQCLQVNTGNGLPPFVNYGRNPPWQITLYQQAIIPSYEFTCCGNITEWGVDVQPGGDKDDGKYTIDFEVWRPSPTTPQNDTLGTGYYSLVGNNRFSAIPLSDTVSSVVRVTPSPPSQDYIQFRPGDVLGFYVEEARNDDNKGTERGVVVLTTSSFTSEVVWYASVDPQNVGGCVSAGSNGNMNTLLRGAPVISIGSSTSDCPGSFPTQPPCPSPTSTVVITSTTSTGTPQPTSAPPPTEPLTTTSENPTTTESPTEPDTTKSDDPDTDVPGTDHSTTTDFVSNHQPPVTATNASPDTELPETPTTPGEPEERETGSTSVVVAVLVITVVIVIVTTIVTSLLIGLGVYKRRRSKTVQISTVHPNIDAAPPVYYDYIDHNYVVRMHVPNTTFHAALEEERQQDQAREEMSLDVTNNTEVLESRVYEVLADASPGINQLDETYQVIIDDSSSAIELKHNDAYSRCKERVTATTGASNNYPDEAHSSNSTEVARNAQSLEEPTTPTRNGSNNCQAECDPRASQIEMKQNDAYTLDDPVMTTSNESYNYAAKFSSSDTEAEDSVVYTGLIPVDKGTRDNGTCDTRHHD